MDAALQRLIARQTAKGPDSDALTSVTTMYVLYDTEQGAFLAGSDTAGYTWEREMARALRWSRPDIPDRMRVERFGAMTGLAVHKVSVTRVIDVTRDDPTGDTA